MPVLDQLAKRVADRLPSAVTPRVHSVADYAVAGAFLFFGLTSWKRNKRAAVSSIGCALFLGLTSAVTDYSGRLKRELPFAAHGRMDLGLSALAAALPGFMGFQKQPEARFFRLQAAVLAGVSGLTDYLGTKESGQLGQIVKAA
jgi:hypothetical protein